jgi:hypothetical protein
MLASQLRPATLPIGWGESFNGDEWGEARPWFTALALDDPPGWLLPVMLPWGATWPWHGVVGWGFISLYTLAYISTSLLFLARCW